MATPDKQTTVLPCNCVHAAQDKKYGQGNRVHNYARKANKGLGAMRCTVCGREK